MEGDVTVRLTVEEGLIAGDARVYCALSVTVTGAARPFAQGDAVLLRVLEDDVPFTQVGDDLLWEREEALTAAEVRAQRFERTYDCAFAAPDDLVGGVELYAYAEAKKADCNFLCRNTGGLDTPSTARISLDPLDDDGDEEDDTQATAKTPGRGGVSGRTARDADWLRLSYTAPVSLRLRAVSRAAGGELSLSLYGPGGEVLAAGAREPGGAALRAEAARPLLPGEYAVQVSPLVGGEAGDFNFYDLELSESAITTDCAPGAEEARPCARCGEERRACSAEGAWGAWGGCEGSGECDPGAEETRACGEDGSQSRTCDASCAWGALSPCVQCEDGAQEDCYTWPEGRPGVGVCAAGRRSCARGAWTSCQGDRGPAREACADGDDNDCDGLADLADPECVGGLGAACGAEAPCAAPWACLSAEVFPEGYCGAESAAGAEEACEGCAGGVCARLAGRLYCLAPCATVFECRFDYLCLPAGLGGELACAPPCSTDAGCGEGFTCVDYLCAPGAALPPTGGTQGGAGAAP
ncbi:MAG: hypothetical protein FJ138_07700, partial [Deltaproteobacteria bacterium]|nr:hypothetical protein [Deltaproteobacteria bacterium]